jgi:signal transduction histidine kinase/ActR/RegA family two-component response regulator
MALRFGDLPIRRKLTWVYVLTSGIALLLASSAFLAFQVITFRHDMVRTVATQAGMVGYNSASALLFNDRESAARTLEALRPDPHIVAAAVYAPDGAMFASYVRRHRSLPTALATAPPSSGVDHVFLPDALLVYSEIKVDGEFIGSVRVLADLEELNALILRYSGIVVLVFLLSLGAALPLLARFQQVISGPIMHLVRQAQIVKSEKNYAVRATRANADELGLLVDSFNEMLAEIQQRDAALERARDTAETANRAKDEFLAVVSHELRTPLTPILAWARMLRGGKLDAAGERRAVEIIERNARSQAQLIEDLLDVSRIITGKLRLDVHPVELPQLVEAAIDSVRPTAEVKGVRLGTVIDPHAGLVAGDPERLKQVVWNLLSNAIKFTPRGGRVQTILRRVNSHLEIAVSDTGQGIAAEFLPYVFDRFRQADASSTRAHGGLGLGLAIVRHLVELHGGRVRAESAGIGQGATFIVELPLSPLAPPTAERRHPAIDGTTASGAHAPNIAGLRVLAVDDDDDTLETLRTLLQQHGAEVRTAASSESGLEVFERWRPDLIISDIGMPGEDGYHFIRRIRARPAGQGGRVPALALTAYARIDDRLQVLSAGFQMHVPKPIEPAELIAVVASLADWMREHPGTGSS